MRSSSQQEQQSELELKEAEPSRKMEQYVKLFNFDTSFNTSANPDYIEKKLCNHLRNMLKIEPTSISKDKYKIKFTYSMLD